MSLTPSGAGADAPTVVADLPPVHGLVAAVMVGRGAPDLLVPVGADPRDHALRAAEALLLRRADIVVTQGREMTPALGPMLDARRDDQIVLNLTALGGLYRRPATPTEEEASLPPEAQADTAEAEAEVEVEVGAEDGGEAAPEARSVTLGGADRDVSTDFDPHLWLDPENAIRFVHAINTVLSVHDPEGASVYAANATETIAAIRGAQSVAELRLAAVAGRPFIVDDGSVGYLSQRFGLGPMVALGGVDTVEPEAASLAMARRAAATASCVFVDASHPSPAAETLADEHGLRVVTFDALGHTVPLGPEHYPNLLIALAEDFAECLGQAD
ncbi:MAG: zinc ABC transporter substrate-binding protein [Pseudomonadota bacterium]